MRHGLYVVAGSVRNTVPCLHDCCLPICVLFGHDAMDGVGGVLLNCLDSGLCVFCVVMVSVVLVILGSS